MSGHQLPRFSNWLFQKFCSEELYEELQGDLEEAFEENVELHGASKAKSIYRKEILKMIRPSVIKKLNLIPPNMVRLPKNYLKTSLRAIKLNPFYVTANIAGMALALSICTIGYFNYRHNSAFNSHFEYAQDLYKIHGVRVSENALGVSSAALAPSLSASGVTAFRYNSKSIPLRIDKKLFQENIGFADPQFFRYFANESLQGGEITNPEDDELIISEKLALKLFNQPYPVGELVTIVYPNKKEKLLKIKDVFAKPPSNSSFFYSAIMSIDNYFDAYGLDGKDWSNWVDGTFVHLPNQEVDRIESLLQPYVENHNKAHSQLIIENFRLDNILDWPAFEGNLFAGHFQNHLDRSSVLGIGGSALAILLLACFNFINTSIALSGKRLKEIAVRKVLGGNRKSTIVQFMIENTFMISLAVIISFGISYILIPTYNTMFQRELIQLDKVPFGVILQFSAILILIVTILSAAYPAFHVSRFPPLVIFRKKIVLTSKNRLMAILLTFQFALCFYNVFAIFLLTDNAEYQETFDRGYDIDPVINIPLNRPEQYTILKDQIAQNPAVTSVAGSFSLVGYSNYQRSLNYDGADYTVEVMNVGQGYSELVGLRLLRGSFLSGSNANTTSNQVLINSMMESQLCVDLLNKSINVGGTNYTVVGVVEDFSIRSIIKSNTIIPTVLKLVDPSHYANAVVRVDGTPEDVNYALEKDWYAVFPQELYRGFLQNQVIDNVRNVNRIMITINLFLGIITILISVIGLYTLISLTVQRRSKEFGVRKVLGASRTVIIHLLGKDLYWMLGIASVVGLSGSAYVLSIVFDIIYDFHLAAAPVHYTQAIFSVLLIVAMAVGYKMLQTGKMNPVEQLRAE